MDKKKEFDVCLGLLRQVAVARGKDPAKVAAEYVWPVEETPAESPAAVSLAPLLTGGGSAPSAGVVPMPSGLTPPKP